VILNAASFMGRLTPGFAARRLGVENMLTVGMGASSVLIFAMIGLGKSVAGYVIIAVLFGYSAGTYISLASPLLASFAENQSEMGARMGIGLAFSGVGALIGGPIDGALITSKFIWWRPALFSGLVTFIGFCSTFSATLILRRRNLRKKIQEKEPGMQN